MRPKPDRWALGIAREYARRIRCFPEVEAVVLFGSRARGDGAPDSDIDVMVVVAEENRELRKALLDIAYDVSWEYGCWLVPAICPEREVHGPFGRYDPFYASIRREGVQVAARTACEYAGTRQIGRGRCARNQSNLGQPVGSAGARPWGR